MAKASRPEGQRLAAFALGSFNLGLTTLLAIFAIHRWGDLGNALSGLNTLIGLAIYAALWALTTWGVGRGLRGVEVARGRLPSWMETSETGARSGAVSGS